jgi:hypothetical protein
MMVFNPQEASVHPLLLDELAAARIDATAGERQGAAGRGVG